MAMKKYCLEKGFQRLFLLLLLSLPNTFLFAAPESNKVNAVSFSELVNVFVGLIFVLGVFLLITHGFKHFSGGRSHNRGNLKIVDGLHIGSRERLLIVECFNQQILLAITPGRIQKLQTLACGEGMVDDNDQSAAEPVSPFPEMIKTE